MRVLAYWLFCFDVFLSDTCCSRLVADVTLSLFIPDYTCVLLSFSVKDILMRFRSRVMCIRESPMLIKGEIKIKLHLFDLVV